MEQQTGSKSGQEYIKDIHCYPAYLYAEETMQNTGLDEAQSAGLETRLPGKISLTSDMQMIPSLWQKAKRS